MYFRVIFVYYVIWVYTWNICGKLFLFRINLFNRERSIRSNFNVYTAYSFLKNYLAYDIFFYLHSLYDLVVKKAASNGFFYKGSRLEKLVLWLIMVKAVKFGKFLIKFDKKKDHKQHIQPTIFLLTEWSKTNRQEMWTVRKIIAASFSWPRLFVRFFYTIFYDYFHRVMEHN